MRPFTTLLSTAIFLLPLAAQDYRDIGSSIQEFKGLSGEVVKKNPLLAAGSNAITATKGGIDSIKNGLGMKEQQATVDREQARRPKAAGKAGTTQAGSTGARAGKARPATSAASRASNGRAASKRASAPAIAPVPSTPRQPEARKVSEESANAIATGMDREQLLASLGPPKSVSGITGIEGGPRETLAYELESGQFLFVKVLGGKVQSISR